MAKQTKIDKKEKKPNGKKIVTVECYVRLGGNALFIDYEGQSYITAQSLVNKLLTGTLKTQKGKKSNGIKLGIKTNDGIDSENKAWLTRKENAIYFSPRENELLIASVDGFQKVLSGEWATLKMGKFE